MKLLKLTATLICCVLLFSSTRYVQASPSIAPMAITSRSASLTKDSNGKAVIKAIASGSSSTKKIKLDVKFQKKNNSNKWNDIKTWSPTYQGPAANFSTTWGFTGSGTYRLHITVTETTSGKTSSSIFTSPVKTI